MCFSPAASFTASAILLTASAATIYNVRDRSQLLFSFIPLIFGIQQLTEGILWVVLRNDAYIEWRQGATLLFAAFGQLVWPLLVPFSVMFMEKEKKRRFILYGFCSAGVLIFCYLLNNMIFHPVYAHINQHHIDYEFDFPAGHNEFISALIYIVPTIGSHFVSGNRKVNVMGAVVLGSLVITKIFYAQFVFSVWCFFSAIISLIVYLVIADEHEHSHLQNHQPVKH
jgi:zinc transporter ZupT